MAVYRQFRPLLAPSHAADPTFYERATRDENGDIQIQENDYEIYEGERATTSPPSSPAVLPLFDETFIQSFPPPNPAPSLLSQLHEYEDFIRRTLRASLPPPPIPRGRWEDMDTPKLHKSRQSSLSSEATTRSSFESRSQQRSLSWSSTAPSTVSSINTDLSGLHYTIDTTRRPTIPSRATSWNGQQNGIYTPLYTPQNVYAPPRPLTLLKPQRLAGQRKLSVSNVPGEGFSKLPREILVVIITELRKLHLDCGDGTDTCATCWMRDLCNLSLTNRKVGAAAQFKLFERIWLVGSDSQRRFKKSPSRLKLLRRTLEANEILAGYVKELKVPDMPEAMATKLDQEKYFEIVASIITSCPNLERLLGLYPAYNHDFSRLTHALSTRLCLMEHIWNIHPNPHQRSSSIDSIHSSGNRHDPLLPEQAASFLSHHYNWPNLTTLVIHCNRGGIIDPQLLSRTFNYLPLPSLAHLALSAIPILPSDLFESLPPLQSLHLSNLPSLTSHLLSSFARSSSAHALTALTLINTNVTSLPTLTRLLSSLTSLTRFVLIQDSAPTLPIGTSIFLHPYLASSSLTQLTWDVLVPNTSDPVHDATRILARAIHAGGFPALRVLKCPTDYDGHLQALCRPVERIEGLPPSYSTGSGLWKGANGPTATLMDMIDVRRKDSGISVTDSNSSSGTNYRPQSRSHNSSSAFYSRSLRIARQAAQARIDAARSLPKFTVIAEDWSEGPSNRRVTARFDIAGFVGTIGSKIEYALDATIDGGDQCGVEVADLLVKEQGKEGSRKYVCDGKWNAWDEKGDRARKGWQHRERVKWKPVEVKRLFT